MRCTSVLLAFVVLARVAFAQSVETIRSATADELALLKDAMAKSAPEPERWAYTELRTMKTSKGKQKGDTIVRFDPSLPYAEQFTPIKIDGQEPTEKQRADYRKRGEQRGQRVARAAEAARGNPAVEPPRLNLGGAKVSLDLEHARFFREDPVTITYEIPVSGDTRDVPIDRFQILLRVNKPAREVENLHARVTDSFRVKLIAKVKAGEVDVDFTSVDSHYNPVMSRIAGDLDVSIIFIPVNGVFSNVRTDFKRVKPYDERFEVKLGPLKALDN